jgi:hypothetical protein
MNGEPMTSQYPTQGRIPPPSAATPKKTPQLYTTHRERWNRMATFRLQGQIQREAKPRKQTLTSRRGPWK